MGMDAKITIIGMGYLMGYLYPCYEALLGDKVATNVNAVTADEAALAEKQAQYPFEITLHDNLAALRKMRPTRIFFAPPPKLAPMIAEDVLVKYYKECRDRGEPLPDLYAFPPSPRGQYYRDLLGQDIRVCNLLPNMISEAAGKRFSSDEGMTMVTFPDGAEWPEPYRQEVLDFFDPLSNVMITTTKDVMHMLAAHCTIICVGLAFDSIHRGLKEAGIDVSFNHLAEAMRVHHEMKYRYYPKGTTVPNSAVVSPEVYGALTQVYDSWHDGLFGYLIDHGISEETAKRFVSVTFDVFLHSYMLKGWNEVKEEIKNQSTKGGVAERANMSYDLLADRHFVKAFREFPAKGLTPEFLKTIRNISYAITDIVALHGDRLAVESATPITETHHAILWGLLFRGAADRLGDKGRDAANKATQLYGHQRGARMAKRAQANGDDLSMRSYRAYSEWTPDPKTMAQTVAQQSPEQITHILQCPWDDAWGLYGFLDEAVSYCSYADEALVYGFNPELKLGVDFFHSDGKHPYCRFIWYGYDMANGGAEWVAAKKKELGDSIKKDWTYHTQHLLSAFNEKLTEQLPQDGPQIVEQALNEFEIIFGTKVTEIVKENQDVDYWAP